MKVYDKYPVVMKDFVEKVNKDPYRWEISYKFYCRVLYHDVKQITPKQDFWLRRIVRRLKEET